MYPKVYSQSGQLQTWEWLRANYGNVLYTPAPAGTAFRLTEIHITEGPATLIVSTQAGQPVANHWPGIQVDPVHHNYDLSQDPNLKTRPYPVACVQSTNANGDTGFGLGTGSYIQNLEAGGPHTVWVLSPSTFSDFVSGIGMLGGTDHRGPLHLVFQLQSATPDPDPEPQPEPESQTDKLLWAILDKLSDIAHHLGVPD